jgi:hypothetical protein
MTFPETPWAFASVDAIVTAARIAVRTAPLLEFTIVFLPSLR